MREEGVEFQFNVQPQYIACDEDGRLTAVGLIVPPWVSRGRMVAVVLVR